MTTRLGPQPRSDGLDSAVTQGAGRGDARAGAARPTQPPARFGHRLSILVLHPWAGCRLRCRMCDIWQDRSGARLEADWVAAEAAAWRAAGLRRVLFGGGEPLLHPDLWSLAAPLRAEGIGLSLLSSGLGLAAQAEPIGRHVDDLIVSLDGPPRVHDRIRGVPGAFDLLAEGVARLRSLAPELSIQARCTVQRGNHDQLRATLRSARELGLDGLSFLAVDLHSEAFNRPDGWPEARRKALRPGPDEIGAMATELEGLFGRPEDREYVTESKVKLERTLLQHFRAIAAGRLPAAASCNAPRVSAVVEADGRVRPCFFHEGLGWWPRDGALLDILAGARSRRFLAAFDPSRDPTCRRCVCRLNLESSERPGPECVV